LLRKNIFRESYPAVSESIELDAKTPEVNDVYLRYFKFIELNLV